MDLNKKIKTIALKIICLLYVILFVYAASNKVLDFENFQVQLGQSPLLSVHASWISWVVILTELGIASLLLIPKLQPIGLYASLGLMTMFSAYIFIILHFSPFIPCSCGGILEKMSWNMHLIFNCIFIVLALFAIVLIKQSNNNINASTTVSRPIKLTIGIIACSILIVFVLFLSSGNIIHHNNPL